MKKHFIFIIVSLLSLSMTAQTQLGFRAGLNVSNYRATAQVALKGKPGPEAAILAEFPVSKLFSVQPELGVGAYGVNLDAGSETARYSQLYAVLPLLLKFNTTEGLSVFAGPQAAIMIGSKATINGEENKEILKEYLSENDFMAVVGAEYKINDNWAASLRYNHGIKNISKQEEVSIRNRAVNISVSYRFGVKGR